MTITLFLFLSRLTLFIWVSLHACNIMSIHSMDNASNNLSKKETFPYNRQPTNNNLLQKFLAVNNNIINAAKKAGNKANNAIKIMYDIAPVQAQAEAIKLNNLHRAKLQAIHFDKFKNTDLQANQCQKYAHAKMFGIVTVEGIMPKIKEYAYNIRIYALAMKIALEMA